MGRINVFGGISGFEKRKVNDVIKNKYCDDNGIHLIRIPYINNMNDIMKILNKELYG